MKNHKKLAAFVAGGTGGHINSALALGDYFAHRGYETLFFTGKRPLDLKLFQGREAIHLDSLSLKGRNPLSLVHSLWMNFLSFIRVILIMKKRKPTFILGAGGYVCGPTCLAAFLLHIPVFVLEQNSVLGLTNRLLLFLATRVFANFKHTVGVPKMFEDKCLLSGNPIRSSFAQIEHAPVGSRGEKLRLLAFGGSLGANSINQLIWSLIQLPLPFSLHIKHQLGGSHFKELDLNKLVKDSRVTYEAHEYFPRIHEEYSWCDVILCRSGASTISELRVVKKPSILVPYPHHADRHQYINAFQLQEEAEFPVVVEDFTGSESDNTQRLANILLKIKDDQSSNLALNTPSKKSLWERDSSTIIFEEIAKYV